MAHALLYQRTGVALRVIKHVGRLVPLVLAGLLVWLGWIGTWALSYRLTQGNEFTYTLLTTHEGLWLKLHSTLALFESVVTGIEPPRDVLTLVIALVASFGVASLGYVAGVVLLGTGLSTRPGALVVVWAITLGAHAILWLMPGTYTTDIFSYVLYGNIAGLYGANPYVAPPSAFADDPILEWINPIWHEVPSVYGPLWTTLSVPVARLTESLTLTERVLAYRGILNVAQLVNCGLVWFLLGRLLPDPSRSNRLAAFAMFAWNPVMLFEVAGNAHNDGFMVTFLLLGLVPLALTMRPARGQPNASWAVSTLVLALSALVKYTSAIVGLLLGVVWLRRMRSWRERLMWMGATAIVVVVVTLALFGPWLADGPQVLVPILGAAGGRYHMNSLTDLAALTVSDQLLDPLAVNRVLSQETARTWAKLVLWPAFAAYLAWEATRLYRRAAATSSTEIVNQVLGASVRAFLVLLLLVFTWVWAWYFTWPLALAVLRGWRDTLARVAVGYTLTSLPIFYIHHYLTSDMPEVMLFVYALPPLLIPLWSWRMHCRKPAQECAVGASVWRRP